MPVTMPAAGAASSYMPSAASAENSRKARAGSTSRSMRSRAVSLPRLRCRATASAPPPSRTAREPRAQIVDQASHRCGVAGEASPPCAVEARIRADSWRASFDAGSERPPSRVRSRLRAVRFGASRSFGLPGVTIAAMNPAPVPAGRYVAVATRSRRIAGPWNARIAAHLLRRAGFGGIARPTSRALPRSRRATPSKR